MVKVFRAVVAGVTAVAAVVMMVVLPSLNRPEPEYYVTIFNEPVPLAAVPESEVKDEVDTEQPEEVPDIKQLKQPSGATR